MKTLTERLHLGLLAALAALVFAASTTSVDFGSDLLRAVAGLGLFLWLGAPWGGQQTMPSSHRRWEMLGGLLIAAVLALGSGLLGALGLAAFVWGWMRLRLAEEARARATRLLPLLVLAMPWVAHETVELGWWFRLSGAWVTEQTFAALGLAVTREGTMLVVEGSPISVEAACSGMQTLPAILLAGVVLLFLRARNRTGYLLGLLALPLLAWAANTARILVLSALALSFGNQAPTGTWHELIGLAVIAAVVLGAASLPALLRLLPAGDKTDDLANTGTALSWLAAAASLFALAPVAIHWLHAPLERHSWLIFGLWLAPLFLRGPALAAQSDAALRSGLGSASLSLTVLSLLLQVHALGALGVPLAAAAFAVGRLRLLPWIIAAVAWMPVAGWALQSLAPSASLGLRLLLAAMGAASALWLSAGEERKA